MHETFFLILGLAGLLTIASFLLPLANRLNFPYTVLLAAAGGMLGAIVLMVGEVEGLWILGDFLTALDSFDITSELVFFVFLPALIFESAINISVRHLFEDIGPILLLAIIGLLISTVAVGTTVWAVSGVGLIACLLLGAIVSATDPVAVIAIFKNLGAPSRLTILVEGESLFNDATAIVLFTILAGILMGNGETTLMGGIADFFKVFLGGVVVGLVLGWIVAYIIGQLHNMPLIEITLTVCLAYFAFLFAEHYLHVSGIMAVVSAGLVTRSYGRTMVSPTTWDELFETWEQLGFWANSLIFFLVGLLVPKVLVDFTGFDLVTLAALTAAAFGARAIVLYLVLPAINRLGLGERISIGFRTVMLWGGLRGAVSLALALVILETPEFDSKIQQFIAVMVTGFVLFTLFVNATTMPVVLKFFGLDRLPSQDLAIRDRIVALSFAHIHEELEHAAREYRIDPAIAHEVSAGYEERLNRLHRAMEQAGDIPKKELQRIGIGILINQERHFYLEHFREGLLPAGITRTLLTRTVDHLQDGLKTGGIAGYREAVTETLGYSTSFRFTMRIYHLFGVVQPLALQLAQRLEELRATQEAVRELIEHAKEQLPELLGEEVAQELEALLQQRYEDTWQALQSLRLHYPDYAERAQKRHLERIALRLEESSYRRMLHEQVISQEIFNRLAHDLNKQTRVVNRQPKLDLGLEPDKLVAKVPFFADLDTDRIAEITHLLEPKLVVPGDVIMQRGETAKAMFFIASGAVEIRLKPEPVQLGSGDFFGAIALVNDQPRKADAVALSYCHLLTLHRDDFRKMLDAYPRLRERIDRITKERLETWFKEEGYQGAV